MKNGRGCNSGLHVLWRVTGTLYAYLEIGSNPVGDSRSVCHLNKDIVTYVVCVQKKRRKKLLAYFVVVADFICLGENSLMILHLIISLIL